ncbi:MAG: carboxymuconolactone decarboxylase family protein [Alphaproteobacteria bacterium]|jgi:alkylhydroperoxidase family enzyme|nr:carboxymuconolactone decarboxylase family protein [Alphaproteobacteria bacterium]
MTGPRLLPLPEDEWTDEVREMFRPIEEYNGRVYNIFRTLARHPKLLKRWLVFANHCLIKSTLGPRERELVILRAGWLCKSDYEWIQHQRIARAAGLSRDEIERVKQGSEAKGWSEIDALLLAATDELLDSKTLGEETWAALKQHFGEQQIIDLIFTAGNYALLAMALNAFGVEVDEGL